MLPDGLNSALTLTRELLGPLPSAISGKKSKAQKHENRCNGILWIFFPEDALSDGPAFWICSTGFADKG